MFCIKVKYFLVLILNNTLEGRWWQTALSLEREDDYELYSTQYCTTLSLDNEGLF